MKKIITLAIVAALMLITLSGCNMSVGIGNFSFEKIHVDTYHQNECFTIETWHDNDSGVEVKTKEAGSMFLSEGTYILIEDECPFCDVEE